MTDVDKTIGGETGPQVRDPGLGPFKVETGANALGIPSRGGARDLRRRFLRNKLAIVGLVMVAVVFMAAAFAPALAPANPAELDLRPHPRTIGSAPTRSDATSSAGSSTAAAWRWQWDSRPSLLRL